MNILVLSDFFPPQLNAGAELIAFELMNAYKNKGNNVSVITINKSLEKGKVVVLKDDGFICYQIGYTYNEKLAAYLGIYNPFILRIVNKIISKNNFEIAHLHNIHKYISYGVIKLLNKHSIPSILTAHDAMSVAYGKYDQGVDINDQRLTARVEYKASQIEIWRQNWKRYNFFRNLLIRHQLGKLKKIVCVSNELEKLLNTNGIMNTAVIHNGLPMPNIPSLRKINNFKNNIGIEINDKVLFFAGRLSVSKGIDQVKLILERLIAKDKNIKLLIVGKRITFKEAISNNVINIEWLKREEMDLAYSVSNITLVPSVYLDPFPTVAIESMRQGIPVMASVYTGAKEAVINGVTGYHFNPYNIDNSVNKIQMILNNPDLNKSMSLQSVKQFNENFTIDKCVNKYLKMIS